MSNGTKLILSALAGILFATAGLWAADKKDVAAVVGNLNGKLYLQQEGTKSWSEIGSGAFLYETDTVRTGPRSRASILFVDGIETRLNANTTFKLEKKSLQSKDKGRMINLTVGRLWTKLLVKVKFSIKTPVAVCAVRGTEYETGVDGNGNTDIRVYSGIVEVSNDYGTVNVNKNSKSSVTAGNPPEDPVPMGSDDNSNWKDELKTSGSLKIELSNPSTLINQVVNGKVSVLDSKGAVYVTYSEKISINTDNANALVCQEGSDKWASSLSIAPTSGVIKFLLRAKSAGRVNVSCTGVSVGAGMAAAEFSLPPTKNLRLKIKSSEGNQKEINLKFKAK
jgi:ferric-dicitrate binding protein FerR (iron transport regulator)